MMNRSKFRRQETGDRRQESKIHGHKFVVRGFSFLLLAYCLLFLSSCGVEEHGGADQFDFSALQPEPEPDINSPDPDTTVPPATGALPPALPTATGDLESFYQNTMGDAGVSVNVSPHALDFGTTREGAVLELPFSLTNQSASSLSLRLNIASLKGGFRIIGASGESAFLDGESVAAGETKEYKVKFLASRAGTTTALVVIQDPAVTGFIHLPVRGTVSGVSGEYRIIPSTHMCSNRNAPDIESLDFLKVASGRSAVKQVKICNKSDRALKIQAVRIGEATEPIVSAALSETRTTVSPFEWFVQDMLDGASQGYYNYSVVEPFLEPQVIDFPPGLPVDGPSSFSVRESSTRRSLTGLLVGPDSYIRVDVRFSPSADVEAPEGQIFRPVGLSAKMVLQTEMGDDEIGLTGATSGREAVLEILHASGDEPAFQRLELTSNDAVDFGEVTVLTDWVTETGNDRFLRFANVGSGSAQRPLKVWLDSLTSGYFIFLREEPERTMPLVIPAGQSRTIKVRYYPPVASATGAADLGQLIVRHNGSNGPRQNVILTGHAKESPAVKVLHGGLSLKPFDPANPPYPPTAPKRFCLVQIGTGTDIPFTVENNSALPGNNLIARWSVTELDRVSADLSSGSVSVPPAGSAPFQIHLTPNEGVVDGEEVRGRLSIRLEYVRQSEFPGVELPSYDVNFAAPARIDGTCTQLGGPLDGTATIVIDRITMNLKGGGMFEPARNLPSFKFHLPIELDLDTRSARVSGLPFNPAPDVPPVDQIRSYAHQITSIRGLGCTPLPTNPYRLEFEPGSWNGPGNQCDNTDLQNVFPNADGSSTCMANNGGEDFREGDITYQVFYHEFVRFNPNDCTISQHGRISTFHRRLSPDEESFEQAFARLQANPGASEDEFAAITRPFQFGSFIEFNQPYDCGGTLRTGTLAGDPEAVEQCWRQMTNDGSITRVGGMLEECSYFQFTIEEGCAPGDPGCAAVAGQPDTYTGYGEYEPYDDPRTPVQEEDESKWDITLRNVHIQAFAIVHGAQFEIFGHASHLLFSDLYVTLTTKAVGGDISASDSEAKELIAVRSRSDFERIENDTTLEGGIFQSASSERTRTYWTDNGINGQFTVEGGDEEECSSSEPLSRCKGNFMFTTGGQYIMHAGEPVDYTQDHARTMLVGLASFHGKQQTAPSFAREDLASGKGPALYFTFHGCLHPGEDLDPSVGCYEETVDGILDDYRVRNMIPEDEEGLINFRIFPEDRDRYTNYYLPDADTFRFEDFDYTGLDCGYGM